MIKVLLVEDDSMIQEVNRQLIEQVAPFQVVSVASNGLEALQLIEMYQPQLLIVDLYMPKMDGMTLLKEIRRKALDVDVIAITAASDIDTVHNVLQNGAFDYIMKPFKFDRLKQALTKYAQFVQQEAKGSITQAELDELRAMRTNPAESSLPKGLNEVTLQKVLDWLNQQTKPISAEEVAEGVGIARVTARRYLDFMEKQGQVRLHIQYGTVGRPIHLYEKY